MKKKHHHLIRLSSLLMMGAILSVSNANAAEEDEHGSVSSCTETHNYWCDKDDSYCAYYPVCSQPSTNTLTPCNEGLKKTGWYTGGKVVTFQCQA